LAMNDSLNIAIVGAGIGGLAAAIALSSRGMNVSVFDEAESPHEAGAGISIPSNAAILLKRTGLCDAIEKITTRSHGLTLRTSRGESVSRPPASPAMQSYQIHRVELLNMLLGEVKGTVRFGHRCTAVNETKIGARLIFANGAVCEADLVIGADGIHSIVQREIGLTASPTSEGIVAYRGLVQSQKLSWATELRGLNMWMGDGRSFICFPVSQGGLINVVAFVPSSLDMEETWFAPGDVKTLAGEYKGWDAPVRDMIAALDQTFRWGIYDRPPLPYWSRGCVTLLGDAAHPMVPHFGQGAGQAIEDGFALAVLLERARRDEIPSRLEAYQNLRLERTSRVQAASRQAGRFYRSADENPSERAELQEWMSAAAWIFPYDAEKAAAALL
jgi:salicylate hydroxylase